MRRIINLIISKIKKEDYALDPNIPLSYLLGLISSRFLMFIRSMWAFKKLKVSFLGYKSVIKCKEKFLFGKGLSIDRNCYIDALSVNGINVGNNFSVGKNSSIECTGSIKTLGIGFSAGNNVGIGSYSFLGCAGGVSIGDDTIIGNYVSFHSENHNYEDHSIPIRLQGVNRVGITIGKNCWIGAKVTILDGARVGDGCIIAAGAVVINKSYPNNSIIGGVPARVIKSR